MGVTSPGAHRQDGRSPSPSSTYRRDIDGLRSIAIVPVVLYHAAILPFRGGYVGVDVFFVISGFLITSLVSGEIDAGAFSLARFYERRIRRIIPALGVVATLAALGSILVLSPHDLFVFGDSLMSMVLFASNLFFRTALIGDGYFGNGADAQALSHTWSLAVEEQFYVFFPLGLMALRRLAPRLVVPMVAAALAASFGLSLWGVSHAPSAAFYLLPFRAWELLLGAILALTPLPILNHRWLREALAALGRGLIGYAIFAFSKSTPFPGLAALAPCAGAALVIAAGRYGKTAVGQALSLRPFVFVGLISYSLYLWHWPVIVFAKAYFVGQFVQSEAWACAAVSVALAWLSYRFVETPFRGKASVFSARTVFLLFSVISLALFATGAVIHKTRGLPDRYSAHVKAIIARNEKMKSDFNSECANYRALVKSPKDIVNCAQAPKAQSHVLFMGDSHVQQIMDLAKDLQKDGAFGQRGVTFAMSSACPPAEHLNLLDTRFHCNTFNRVAMKRALSADIGTVYIGFAPWWTEDDNTLCFTADTDHCVRTLSRKEASAYFLRDLKDQVHRLRAKGKHVILALPFPRYDRSIPDLEIHNAVFGPVLGRLAPKDVSERVLVGPLRAIAQAEGAVIFDPRPALCAGDDCLYQVDGVSIYKDESHIAASQIFRMAPALRQVFVSLNPAPARP